MTQKELLWREMQTLKRDIYYLELISTRASRIDTIIRSIVAFSSSSSIAAWTIWKNLAFIWGIIIAAGHILTVLADILPYRNQSKTYPKVLSALYNLSNQLEIKWDKINEGSLPSSDIAKTNQMAREEATSIFVHHLGGKPIPKVPKYYAKAKELMFLDFKKFMRE